MQRLLKTIEGVDWIQHDDGSVTARGCRARVCTDGKGVHHGDKTAQDETAYPGLNADLDYYGVVPMCIRALAHGIVIGSQMRVEDTKTGMVHDLVTGDTGPDNRSGEFARIVIGFLGFKVDPNKGGCNEPRFNVTFWPNRPAIVGTKRYKLIPAA